MDYVGNLGGGVRFTVELMRALVEQEHVTLQLFSHGVALERYRSLLENEKLSINVHDLLPRQLWRYKLVRSRSLPARVVRRLLPRLKKWHYEVPLQVFADCDVVWLPWTHYHGVPSTHSSQVVGSFHDAIVLEFPHLLLPQHRMDEMEVTRGWLESEAQVVVSSHATVAVLQRLFDVSAERFSVIPLSGAHLPAPSSSGPRLEWEWTERPFLLCPANISNHKNHEVLLEGVAAWDFTHPLVLTGEGAGLRAEMTGREADLHRFAREQGFEFGSSLLPLGYTSNEVYFSLLRRAWALVMPTLAEGGGSFPVWEALLHGVPVVCSDIPVLREQMERLGASVLWFDPSDPAQLAARLDELERDYPSYRARAREQIGWLRHRSWGEVAEEYQRVFERVVDVHQYGR